jgi:nitroreductase
VELAEVLRRRRMVRRFDPDRPVPDDVVTALLAAALRAPTAGDTQAVSFLVLSDPADLEAYWQATARPGPPDRWLQGMRAAPLLVLVWTSREAYLDRYAEPDKGWGDRDPDRWSAPYWFVDAGMASMAALLTVVDAELAGCFFGVPADRASLVRQRFGVPADQLSVGVIGVGYPEPTGAPPRPGRARRQPPGRRVHRGHWSL